MIPLIGYANRASVRSGEEIHFKVSSTSERPYEARLVRVLCGDANPHGPGFREVEIGAAVDGTYPSRVQPVHLGSFARIDDAPGFGAGGIRFGALIWPTLPGRGRQALISRQDAASGRGVSLAIDERGAVSFSLSDGSRTFAAACEAPLRARCWYEVSGGWDPVKKRVWAAFRALRPSLLDPAEGSASVDAAPGAWDAAGRPLVIAAAEVDPGDGPAAMGEHYNGKLEAPVVTRIGAGGDERVFAEWDFARGMTTQRIEDLGPDGLHGELVNLPARAMTGAAWTGRIMRWTEAPEEFAAIHFHDDDIYDCGWATDFSWVPPEGFPSGNYAMRLRCGDHEDHIPFTVCPHPGKPAAKVAFLVSTFTQMAYCNFDSPGLEARTRQKIAEWGACPYFMEDHPEYGRSTYNHHNDGSGICFSSRLRPNLNMRPRFIAATDPKGSGLRHAAADTYVTAWLEHCGEPYDVITDEDVHEDGIELLRHYTCVVTGGHPEYHTPETIEALQAFIGGGGRLMYLGGNGFYWKVAVHPDLPGVIELRRAEGGIRLWAAEPGEYYHAFDGSYGGLWRRNGRPPNRLVGVGFSSQGNYEGSYYRRQPGSFDPRAAFIFEGVGPGELIGDFGFFGGGAAGFEVDRADPELGTPPHALVLASSEGHGPMFRLVNEEMLRQFPDRPDSEILRADLVFFETPNGGAVFSVGSITYIGSLPYNGYRNNVATITTNVLRRFVDPTPFRASGLG